MNAKFTLCTLADNVAVRRLFARKLNTRQCARLREQDGYRNEAVTDRRPQILDDIVLGPLVGNPDLKFKSVMDKGSGHAALTL